MLPQRQRPADHPSAMWQEGQLAADDIKAVTGIYDATLGARSNETSGRAINARKGQSAVTHSDLGKNLALIIAHCGRVMIDLIPKVYDSRRVIRLLGEDGGHRFVEVNKAVIGANNEQIITNDLSIGRFDVRVKTGPSFMTRREEVADKMLDLMASRPEFWSVMGDLVFDSLDFPEAERIAKRLKKTIPPHLLEGEELLSKEGVQGHPNIPPKWGYCKALNKDPHSQTHTRK